MALAGGGARAAIGDGGVIHGCYDSGGNLKVVPSLPCPKGYTELSWNQQGVNGDKGDKGDTGATGPQSAPQSLFRHRLDDPMYSIFAPGTNGPHPKQMLNVSSLYTYGSLAVA